MEVDALNIHGIEFDSMTNGDGLRLVLWVSGCEHHCKGCHNPQTHDSNSGRKMTVSDLAEIVEYLGKDYVSGITFSGGDPLHLNNRSTVTLLAKHLKTRFPNKTIWLYTGYTWEEIKYLPIMKCIDVLVDGKFKQELADVNYHWCGSTNQRVIDVQKSLTGKVVLHEKS